MNSSRKNWERLVEAVLRRDELSQLCYLSSPSISTITSDSDSEFGGEILDFSSNDSGPVSAGALETVVGLLSSAALQEIGLQWGLKDELNKLESTFRTIQLVIHDAELKQRKDKVLQNWLRMLKDAAYDAENILDVIATEGLRRRANSERGMQYQLKSFLSLRTPPKSRLKMAHKVKNIREKLDSIAKDRRDFHLGEGVVENRFGVTLESRHTTSLVNESEIFGRHEEKEVIMEKLLGGDQDDLSVCAIQGMGGLGKTTLAKMVFNDKRTERHFDPQIWVCVSNDFIILRIIREILESLEGVGCNISALDPLQRRLQERLRGRRFLLVLDDVWNENFRLWDELKEVLRCGSKGSMVMVTTRIEKVASMMAPIAIHRINYLSEDDSWSLFKQRAFTNGEGEETYIAIGKAIVKKCGGVPLAIKALGSLMRLKSEEKEWLAVKESEIWHLSEDENAILPVLRLSYDNLLPQMRRCFAYCCIFPKDYEMEESQLIQLWMANGYIPSDGPTDMHLTGHLIFKELVRRSFLQDVEVDFEGNVTCKMHDLMHDLASSVMQHETYILEHNKMLKIPKTLRHLSFDLGWSWYVPNNKSMLKLPIDDDSLRSIIVHEISDFPTAWRECFSSLLAKQQYLRALHVSGCNIKKLPDLVCKLEHLRYLVMNCANIKRLPDSLAHLCNLQTLKLKYSYHLLELPKGLRVMKNLWFLELDHFDSLLCTPPGLGDLTCLHGLSIFIAGQHKSHQIDQLKELNLLGGALSIKGLDNVRDLEDARSANLMAKMNLTSLSLYWESGIKEKSAEHFEEVLAGLQPHQNLERISIKSYHGFRFPNWMSTLAFEKLKEINLSDCPRCQRLPSLGKLPCLARLYLRGMDSIKCLDEECYADGECSFPALTKLSIIKMSNLEKWAIDDSVESFSCLKDFRIEMCPKLTGLPKLPSLDNLNIYKGSAAFVGSIMPLTSLTSLTLSGIEGFEVLPEGLLKNHMALERLSLESLPIRTLLNVLDNLSTLKTLNLSDCSNLEFLPEGIKHLISLETLYISGCNGLGSFPATLLEGLSSLRTLQFENCEKLKPLSGPLKQAPPLHDLLIIGLPELEYLPESMQLLKTLRSLGIWNCHGLSSLPNWLGSLESLSDIEIWDCRKLKSLPDGFKSLKSLKQLEITACPELEKRCEKPKGEDWPKISHIPIIRINSSAIQQHLDE